MAQVPQLGNPMMEQLIKMVQDKVDLGQVLEDMKNAEVKVRATRGAEEGSREIEIPTEEETNRLAELKLRLMQGDVTSVSEYRSLSRKMAEYKLQQEISLLLAWGSSTPGSLGGMMASFQDMLRPRTNSSVPEDDAHGSLPRDPID